MNDNKNKGEIAKLLRLVKNIDKALEVTGDKNSFGEQPATEVNAISQPLLSARMATKNLLRKLGYPADNVGFPPHQHHRGA